MTVIWYNNLRFCNVFSTYPYADLIISLKYALHSICLPSIFQFRPDKLDEDHLLA